MIKIKSQIFITILSIIFVFCSSPQKNEENKIPNSVITKYTELKTIISKEVDDTFYVYVRLPKHYKSETENYPVLYLLDGDIAFDMSTSIIRYLQYANDVPDLIIIGIGYGTMLNDGNLNFRERDYTFTKIAQLKDSGGADKYLKFLKNELVPFVEKNYRTDGNRILEGYSLGGLFTIYTMLTENNLFSSYIAGSPYLKENIDSLITLSKQSKKYNKKLFVTVGEKEDNDDFRKPISKLFNAVSEISENKNNIKMEVFKNGTHFTCPSEALTYGIQFIFNDVKPSAK
jgi:uncharacterized protein